MEPAEQAPNSKHYRPMDVVLAGHAHWELEFHLESDPQKNKPAAYYGDFTVDPNGFRQTFEELHPFLLQTPVSGPREVYSPEPPYFRWIENVTTAEVSALRADETAFSPKLST